MTVTFRCGHAAVEVGGDVKTPPTCPVCGERVVSRVTGATPRFTGACTGPLVQKGSAA